MVSLNRIRLSILIITVIALLTGFIIHREAAPDERAALEEIAPGVEFSEKHGQPPHFSSPSGIVAFNSYDIVPDIKGYAGPIKVLIALDRKGTITGIKILQHRETENYVHYMLTPQYLSQFIGKNVSDPFEPDRDIDAISRATISVKALADTVRESSRMVASEVLGLEVKQTGNVQRVSLRWISALLLIMLSYGAYFITRRNKRLLRLRDLSLIAGILILGFYLSAPFSIIHVFNLLLTRISLSPLWLVTVMGILTTIILSGRFYCGWLCPFGAFAEFIGRIPSRKWKLSQETDMRWRNLKYFILLITVAIVLSTQQTGYGAFETYLTLFSFHGSILTWALVIFMLLINLRVERFWCRYLCPVGAFSGLLSREDKGYISVKECPMTNPENPYISECIKCNRCYKSRP